jgi:hypothetical protein
MAKSFKKHLTKISSYSAVGSLGLVVMSSITGCEHREEADNFANTQSQGENQGYFIVIQETAPEKYELVEQYPTPGTTRAILKKLDGTEELLSEEDLKRLSAAEGKKVEEGSSRLTQDEGSSSMSSGGMSMGEAILASAAGAMIGAYLGNKLFGNKNYQKNTASNPSSKSPRKNGSAKSSSTKKGGFFGNNRKSGGLGFGG